MELYFNRENLSHVRNILNTSITQEETMEMIVPDSLPDILRIICVDTTILIRGKDADTGRVSVSGIASATVIYAPDGAEGVRKINAEIPFTISAAESEITSASKLIARVSAVTADASVINPRKFVLRTDIRAELSCYNEAELAIASDVDAADDSVEFLRESRSICIPVDVREKSFVIADEIALPGGTPEIGDILSTRAAVTVEESKIVGNKVIFRGSANIALLYIPADDSDLRNVDLISEFSQIMELENISEECNFDIILMLTGVYVDAGGIGISDNRSANVELHAVAQCIAAENKTISFISDVYSTRHAIEQIAENVEFEHREPPIKSTTLFREIIDGHPGDVSRVIAVSATTGAADAAIDDGSLTMKAPIHVTCIYAAEDGRIQSLIKRFETDAQLGARHGSAYLVSAAIGGEVQGAVTGEGIEIKVPVEFNVTETALLSINLLSEVSLDEESVIDTSAKPSLIIAKTVKDDTFWKLAKRHFSTPALILSANDLDIEDGIVEGQMLIIPKKR